MRIFLTSILCCAAGAANATTYYVNSATGSDSYNGLSTSSPFATISHGASVTNPGDKVIVYPGNGYVVGSTEVSNCPIVGTSGYTDISVAICRSGSAAGGNITFMGVTSSGSPATPYTNSGPIISMSASSPHYQAVAIEASYIVFEGFYIPGYAPNTTLTNCQSNGGSAACAESGISVGQVSDIAAGNIYNHNQILNNSVYNHSGAGIAVIGNDYATISGNLVQGNANYSAYGDSGISLYGSQNLDNGTEIKNFITDNVAYNNQELVNETLTSCGNAICDGEGIILDDNSNDQTNHKPYVGGTLVENNLSYYNGSSGIEAYDGTNYQILYNTTYGNGRNSNSPVEIYLNAATYGIVENNIMYAPNSSTNKTELLSGTTTGSVYDYNVIYNGSNSAIGAHDINANPDFVNPGTGALSFVNFGVTSSSPAINAANTAYTTATDLLGNARPTEASGVLGYDIGAYQYVPTGGGNCPPAPP
jgi:hypothetical protein